MNKIKTEKTQVVCNIILTILYIYGIFLVSILLTCIKTKQLYILFDI